MVHAIPSLFALHKHLKWQVVPITCNPRCKTEPLLLWKWASQFENGKAPSEKGRWDLTKKGNASDRKQKSAAARDSRLLSKVQHTLFRSTLSHSSHASATAATTQPLHCNCLCYCLCLCLWLPLPLPLPLQLIQLPLSLLLFTVFLTVCMLFIISFLTALIFFGLTG